jgi:hypothetical protein
MDSRLILAAGAACLVAMAGTVHAQGASQQPTPSAQPTMQQNAEAPAQAGADTSYGGTPSSRSAAGKMSPTTCTPRPQCDVFFGN